MSVSSVHSFSSSLSSAEIPQSRKLGLALFACVQNALVGGLVFGWASIDRTMLQAPLEEGGAALTATQTTQLFTYASSTAMLASLFLGPLLDAGGPRACLATSHFSVILGCGGFAVATKFWQYSLAVIAIAFGGPGIGISIIHVANLFPQNQFLAVSCLAGSITLSFSMLAILEIIWETYAVGYRTLFGAYCLVAAASMIGTLIMSPDDPYELEEEEDGDELEQDSEFHPSLEQEYIEATIRTYAHHHQNHLLMTDQSFNSTLRREGLHDHDVENDESLHHHASDQSRNIHMHLEKRHSFFLSQRAVQSGSERALKLMSLKDQPFLVQLQSPTFARAVIIFITTSFLANFTIASLTTELQDLPQFESYEQHDLSQQFTWLMSLGMLYAVLVGWLMDRFGLEVCTLLTLVLGQLSSLLILVGTLHHFRAGAHAIMVSGFAVYSLFRQFLFPVFLAYVTARFGFKYFGILTGIGFALSGLAQCFMAKLVEWVHEFGSNGQGWIDFHILQILLLTGLMVIPIADHRDIQLREAAMEQALRRGKASPRSVASATTATSTTPIWQERKENDVEYGSLVSK